MSQSSSSSESKFKPVDRSWIKEEWMHRFGLTKDVFNGLFFFRRGRMIWAFSQDKVPSLRYESVGLRIMSMREIPWKPTTYALQLFGGSATKNVVDMEGEQAEIFMAGGCMFLQPRTETLLEDGYVIVRYGGDVLGCGLYTSGRLISQLPKERRISVTDKNLAGDEESLC